MRHNARFTALLVALALVSVACVRDNEAEPGVNAITTDLQYKQLQQRNAAPPNTVPTAPTTLTQPTIPPFGEPITPGPAQPVLCPTAAPTTESKEDAAYEVNRLPETGKYLWKVSGREIVGKNRFEMARFTFKEIRKVEGDVKGKATNFTYQTLERELAAGNPNAGTARSFFSVVNTSSTPDRTETQSEQGVEVSSGRLGNAGVRLTRIEVKAPDGQTRVFAPNQPVRYLITPVLIGPNQGWTDQVVDAVSDPQTQILTHKAFVKGRITIDACGERLRGWLVSAETTYQFGSSSVTRHYEYGVATQLGGIIISEHIESPCTRGTNGKCAEGDPKLLFDANLGKRTES